jgi:hypothetical protein
MGAVLSTARCLAVSAVVVVAGVAAVGIWPTAWPGLIIVTAVVVAGVSPGLSATAQQRWTNVEKITRQGLQWTKGLALLALSIPSGPTVLRRTARPFQSATATLPRVGDSATLDARVHRVADREDVTFALEACTGWRYIAEELAVGGIADRAGLEMAKTAVPANDMKMAPTTAEPRVQECQIAGLRYQA